MSKCRSLRERVDSASSIRLTIRVVFRLLLTGLPTSCGNGGSQHEVEPAPSLTAIESGASSEIPNVSSSTATTQTSNSEGSSQASTTPNDSSSVGNHSDSDSSIDGNTTSPLTTTASNDASPNDSTRHEPTQSNTSSAAEGSSTAVPTGPTDASTTTSGNMGVPPAFLLGADISSLPEFVDAGATFVDTDGQTKPLPELLQNHGFNAIRLRTFVNPSAPYGYAGGTGNECAKAEAYNDATHTAELGAQIKALGMQLLVDFHYSDTWADPGKQIIPEAWRNAENVDDLASRLHDYTTATLNQLIAAGAKPDLVQVGNETTPGMLIHVPGAETDCWGNNSVVNAGLNGQASNENWDNLATLLKAGASAVKAVDPSIQVVLHIENTDDLDGVRWWVSSATSRGVEFDILGLSAYTAFQGQPSVWSNTLQAMAEDYPDLKFIIAEYNPERTLANEVVRDVPGARGVGTFFWEPTQSGSWGDSMFTQSNNTYTARAEDFAEYDALRTSFGL